ncbi:MAG TPA: L-histidine N(alpha)-methyltransferase, partial [Rhizomicrobium sp.]
HYAPYNAGAHRIEMYLVSLKRQSVTITGQRFDFAAGEPVHTEDSHKYTIESFREMAARAGFNPRAVWTDEERLFSVHWLETRTP